VAQYQFSAAQLHSITIGIEGMSEASALNYIKRQAGVDANTITFHLSGGSTLPTVTKNIKIITVAPTTLPTFALPTVTPAASATP